MPPKSHYDLLNLSPTASQDEVKKAFRLQIARYHPDKVQHLGPEFHEMATERAAELTEAYRILSDEGRRAEYDRTLGEAPPRPPAPPARTAPLSPTPQPETPTSQADVAASETPGARRTRPGERPGDGGFTRERTSRDAWLFNASISRFRQALHAVGGSYEESSLRGFDVACVPKSRLFDDGKRPRLLGRFVTRVDGAALAEAWTYAAKWGATSGDGTCVFLMGMSLAPARELAGAIAEQRRRTRSKVTLIPVDARDWEAHMPTDAPAVAKAILAQLRKGT